MNGLFPDGPASLAFDRASTFSPARLLLLSLNVDSLVVLRLLILKARYIGPLDNHSHLEQGTFEIYVIFVAYIESMVLGKD